MPFIYQLASITMSGSVGFLISCVQNGMLPPRPLPERIPTWQEGNQRATDAFVRHITAVVEEQRRRAAEAAAPIAPQAAAPKAK